MAAFQRLSTGRWRIVGGKLLKLNPAAGVSPDTLDLVDFHVGYLGTRFVVQRKQGSLSADVAVLFTYTGSAPTHPQARVVAAAGGAVVHDWTTLTSISAAGGEGIGYLDDVPEGTGYLIQLRDGLDPADSNTNSSGSVQWGVGPVIAGMGQSNMLGTLYGGSISDIVPGTSQDELTYYNAGVPGSIFDNGGWHRPSNGGDGPSGGLGGGMLALMRIVSEALEVEHGYPVPVGLIPWAHNSASIGQFLPGGTHYVNLFDASGTTAGTIGFASPQNIWSGDFEIVLWHQGEGSQDLSQTGYKDALDDLYQSLLDYVAPFGRTASGLWFFPAILGVYGPGTVSNIERTRRAVQDFAAAAAAGSWPCARIGWTTIDLDPSLAGGDQLHFSYGSHGFGIRSMRRAIQSVLYATGCATYSGAGPTIGTHSRSGNVITFNVVHEGGTALQLFNSGNPPTGWYANTSADFTGTDITPTVALINSNTQIQITLPGGTSYPVYIKYCGNEVGSALSEHPDVSNLIYDNAPYPSTATGSDVEAKGLPLQPSNGAITVS